MNHTVLKFDMYLWGSEYVLHCDYKPLDTFLSKGIKIPKLKEWSLELTDYNMTFVHIESKNNVLTDTISRLEMLDIYKEAMENPKISTVSNMQEHVTEVHATNMHTLSTTMLCTE